MYLVREITFGQDGDFSWERFEGRYNSDLANNLGNLVNRTTSMVSKYRQGTIAPSGGVSSRLPAIAEEAVSQYRESMERLALQDGAAAAYRLIDTTNEFINENAPWALAKDPTQADRLSAILFDMTEAVRIAAILLLPVMPSSCEEILRRVGMSKTGTDVRLDPDADWGSAGELTVQQGSAIWPRIEIEKSAG
jgi:methionyl-tRNA synthetase